MRAYVVALFLLTVFAGFHLLGKSLSSQAAVHANAISVHDQEPSANSDAASVYDRVSPSVAFLETPGGTGSGILLQIDGSRYIATNAHVVWPFSEARVVFPSGEEHATLPILSQDHLIDLALLGPIETDVTPLELGPHETVRNGDDLYVVGYPGEGELFPMPAISRGILSRRRDWDLPSVSYFQADAATAGGQSGGIMTTAEGHVIGITGMTYADAFVLATSSADIQDRLLGLARNEDVDGLGSRSLPQHGRKRRLHDNLANLWDTNGYVTYVPAAEKLNVTVNSQSDVGLLLFDAFPAELDSADDTETGVETLSTTVEASGPHFLVVEQYGPGLAQYSLRSDHRLALIDDQDDQQHLQVGDQITGRIDYPADVDTFLIDLERGQKMTFCVESALIDPRVAVGPADAPGDQFSLDDDSGRGIFGINARLEYAVLRTGPHVIAVHSHSYEDIGGYLLVISDTNLGC